MRVLQLAQKISTGIGAEADLMLAALAVDAAAKLVQARVAEAAVGGVGADGAGDGLAGNGDVVGARAGKERTADPSEPMLFRRERPHADEALLDVGERQLIGLAHGGGDVRDNRSD